MWEISSIGRSWQNKKCRYKGLRFLWRLNESGEDNGAKYLWILIGKG